MSSNSIGKNFTFTTWGESHGKAIGCVIDGVPSNIKLEESDIQPFLDKRKPGQSKYTTQRKEEDKVEILSGVFEGLTTGHPISLIINNSDQRSKDYSDIKDKFRPGHADYTYQQKYGIRDYRGGGRASARETAMRVAGGAIAKKILATVGVNISAGVVQIGDIQADKVSLADTANNDFNFVDTDKISELETFFQALIKDQDSVGAKILVRINGLMPGVGSPVFSKLDAELAKAMMGVNAVKAVEIGAGANVVNMRGSGNRDLMVKAGFLSNNSGGILGGISNGEDIDIYVSLKPTSSISQKTTTVNKDNEEVDLQVKGRHDPCVGLRAAPILEAMAALCILDQVLLDKGQCFNVDRDS